MCRICQAEIRVRRVTASAAILTLPLGVWKAGTVAIKPSLRDKQQAIAELQFGNMVRVLLVFTNRWWPKSKVNYGPDGFAIISRNNFAFHGARVFKSLLK